MSYKKLSILFAGIFSAGALFADTNEVQSTVDVCGPIPNGWNLIYKNNPDGTPNGGDLEQLKKLITQGANIKVNFTRVTRPEPHPLHAYHCETVYYDSTANQAVCVTTSVMSLTISGENFGFPTNINDVHHWYAALNSAGKLSYHTQYLRHRAGETKTEVVPIEWFAKCS